MANERVEQGIAFLADAGLNLFASLAVSDLPASVHAALDPAILAPFIDGRLVLLGHGGRRLWSQLQQVGPQTADPVDHYSITLTQTFIETYCQNAPHRLLYPHDSIFLPLGQLGEFAGWCRPSPLGLGIHPVYGLWFAYRAAFLIDYPLPLRRSDDSRHMCADCREKPCLTACPPAAVQLDNFDVKSCVDFRLQASSSCAARCLARLACPIAPEHRYTPEQIAYHYRHSLQTIKRYQDSGKNSR